MKILHALLLTLGILLASITALAAFFLLFAEVTNPQHYTYTEGTVVQVSSTNQQDNSALVRFNTREGIQIEFQMPDAFPRYLPGARIPVKYLPQNPNEAYNASFAANALLGIGLLWFSILCIALLYGPRIFRRYIWQQVAISIRLQKQRL
jgi:hypothetical protein